MFFFFMWISVCIKIKLGDQRMLECCSAMSHVWGFFIFQLYEEIFEAPFLQASGEYYKREASRLLQECDVSQYMERVIQRLDEETLRSNKFLHYR